MMAYPKHLGSRVRKTEVPGHLLAIWNVLGLYGLKYTIPKNKQKVYTKL